MSEQHWNNVRAIHREWKGFYEVAGGSTVVMILLIFGGFMFTANILDDYTTNVFTEGLGVLATVLIVDLLNRRRAEQERKEELIFQMGSEDNSTALAAVRILKHKGWLQDGSLRHANLSRANLCGAILEEADLAYCNLEGADLSDTSIQHTILDGANLRVANLETAALNFSSFKGSSFRNANLRKAHLVDTKLSDADLFSTDLQEATFYGADLTNALLFWAKLDQAMLLRVKLPDEHEGKWTQRTDMTRYTDPNHPDFWQPEWAKDQSGDET